MVPVHLNETEDQVNDTDDQTADLNKLRKRDHGLSPLSIKNGDSRSVPQKEIWRKANGEDTPRAVYRQHP